MLLYYNRRTGESATLEQWLHIAALLKGEDNASRTVNKLIAAKILEPFETGV